MKLVGLPNLGSTCYINSVIQCLIYIKEFRIYINKISKSPEEGSQEIRILYMIINNTFKGDSNNIVIENFNLSYFNTLFMQQKPWFKECGQNDAHEYLICLLDILQNKTIDKNLIDNSSSKHKGRKNWIDYTKKFPSIITELFYGQTQNSIKCLRCENITNNFEISNCINLNVPKQKESVDLVNIFINFLKKELNTDQNNLYQCDSCHAKTETEHKLYMWKIPRILVICLKRYDFTKFPPEKINTKVDFPLVNLNIKETSSGEIKNYNLFATVNHFGLFHGGHYISNVLINKKWIHFDDNCVHLSEHNIISSSVYILFYRLQDN